jgi:hypothetical protein
MRRLAATTCAALALSAVAATDIVAELSSRLERDGLEAVNAYVSGRWESVMGPLARKVEQCDAKAMQLALQLHRGTNAEATQAHAESLSLAVGRCPAKLLPLIPPSEIAQFCSVAGTVPESDLKREIDRRIRGIGANALLNASQNGRACVAAYKAEAQRAALGPWQTDSTNGRATH